MNAMKLYLLLRHFNRVAVYIMSHHRTKKQRTLSILSEIVEYAIDIYILTHKTGDDDIALLEVVLVAIISF